MKAIQNTIRMLGLAVGLCVVVGVLAWVAAPAVVAQIRAAVVKNVDEPGRAPYEAALSEIGACNGSICHFNFPAVPAGKRLVVTNVSGLLFGEPALIAFVNDVSSCTNCLNRAVLTTPTTVSSLSGADAWTFNDQVKVSYEPGTTPRIKIIFNSAGGFFHNLMIQGYLVDLAV